MRSETEASNSQQKIKFLKAEQILPSRIYRQLSHGAHRLYTNLWNRCNRAGVLSIWIRESDVANRAGLDEATMNRAKSELVKARLIRWELGLSQTKFTFVDPDAPDADEWSSIFTEPTE
jgi:hypothetical protein